MTFSRSENLHAACSVQFMSIQLAGSSTMPLGLGCWLDLNCFFHENMSRLYIEKIHKADVSPRQSSSTRC